VYQGRLTWQANPKNKVGVTYDQESNCFCPDGVGPPQGGANGRTAEAGTDRRFSLQRFVQVDWNTPISSKLLLEASGIHRVERWGGMQLQTGNGDNIASLDPRMIGVIDTATSLNYRAAAQGIAPGSPPYNNSWNWNLHYRAALSYVSGSHVMKVGFNNAYGYHDNYNFTNPNALFYTFVAGVPATITEQAAPYTAKIEVNRDLGIFAQDKWTKGHWTLMGGIRYDSFANRFPEQSLGPTRFTPNRNISYPEIDNISWNDITPKMGATWDIFGDGKTAFKITLNKYLLGYGTLSFADNNLSSQPNPITSLFNSTNRSWDDRHGLGINGDFIPQCNLLNPAANGECGAIDQPLFGTAVPSTTYDPNLLTGWGKRNFNWEFSTGIQREILPRVSLDLSYFRRWYGNFQAGDNRAFATSDYQKFNFNVPAGLPNAGQTLTAYDLPFPLVFAPPQTFVTLADNLGTMTEHWNGVDLNVNSRLMNGVILQGGFSTGRLVLDDCDLTSKYPEMLQTFFGAPTILPFFAARPVQLCHQDQGFTTQYKATAAYVLPKVDVQIAGAFQSLPGPQLQANYLNFDTGTLGRPFGTSAIVPFRFFQVLPTDMYGERLNQLDFRLSKIFRFSAAKTVVNFDWYNLMNGNAVITENFTATAPLPFLPPSPWRTPTSILQSRFFKISAQFDF